MIGVVTIVVLFGVSLFGETVFGQTQAVDKLRQGATELVGKTPLPISNTNISTSQLPTLIGRIIGNILSLLGIVFFLLTLYAGLLWMFARGDESKAGKAADIIKGAIAGLIVVLGSYALTNLVFDIVGFPNSQEPSVQESADAPLRNPGTRPTGDRTTPIGGLCVTDEECVNLAVCQNSRCVDLCTAQPPSAGGGYACRDVALCDEPSIVRNLCSGGVDRVCCREAVEFPDEACRRRITSGSFCVDPNGQPHNCDVHSTRLTCDADNCCNWGN